MENDFKGTIIEESLENKNILKTLKITETKVEKVTEDHKTPWIKQWTLHNIEIPEQEAENIALQLSKALDTQHNWYADFKNEQFHYIIYRNKVFKIDRTKKEEYNKATKYGISLGIPDYQVDFSPHIKQWER